MISTSVWVPRGYNLANPIKVEVLESDLEKVKQKLNLANQDLNEYKNSIRRENGMEETEAIEIDEDLKQYNLQDYDEETNVSEINLGDKELTVPDENLENQSESETELSNLQITPQDSLLVIGRSDPEISQLEIYLYEESESNIYIHHDIMLPSLPLSLEWFSGSITSNTEDVGSNFSTDVLKSSVEGEIKKGSYVAVGSFDTTIELWDLDLINPIYPTVILGKEVKVGEEKKNDEYHVDAVMGLSWNRNHPNLLLSSSADCTVKLWDLSTNQCIRSFNHHTDKVQAVKWHPTQSTVFMSGGFDRKVHVLDSRTPQNLISWHLQADIETLAWDPNDVNRFMISDELGAVHLCDIRNPNQPLFTIQAHHQACNSICIHPIIPNLLITGSSDGSVKVWDFNGNKPSMVLSKNFELGEVFTIQPLPESPLKISLAGSRGKLIVWDLNSQLPIRQKFKDKFNFPKDIATKQTVELDDFDDEDMEEENM